MRARRQSGQALFTALIFLLALTFLGFGLVTVATMDVNSSRNLRISEESMSAAEEGALFALAWVPNHIAELLNAPGRTMTINSVDNAGKLATDRQQFTVTVTLGDMMAPPPGYTMKAQFNELVVQSMGSVSDSSGFIFSAGNSSIVQRRVEVLARVQTGFEE